MAHIVTDATQSQLNATNVLYPGGTTVAYLQPAQPGATLGTTWGSNLAGQPQDLHNLILTPTFQSGLGNWSAPGTVAVTGQDFTAALKSTARDTVENGNSFPVVSGQRLYVCGWINTSGSTLPAYIGVWCRSAAGANLWVTGAGLPAGTGWGYVGAWLTVPAGAITGQPWLQQSGWPTTDVALFAQLYIGKFQPGSDITSQNTAGDTVNVNGVASHLISPISTLMPSQAGADQTAGKSLDILSDGNTYKRPLYVNSSGTFSVSTILNAQGSIVPNQAITVSPSYTTSSVSLSWGAQSFLRADGSMLNLPAGSQTWSGLSSSMSYYIYPRIQVATGTMAFANSNPPTTSPNSTYATQTAFDGYIAVPPLTITTSSSTGTGGGSAGGGNNCPEAAELVDVQGKGNVTAGSIQVGDMIRGKCFKTGEDVYRLVMATSQMACAAWRIVDGHRVSPCEAIYYNNQWMPAFRVPGSIFDTFKGTKINITVDTDSYDEANYYLVSNTELLIHNMNISPC